MPELRTDGLSGGWAVGVRSRDYQIFSDGLITSFSYPWCSAPAITASQMAKQMVTLRIKMHRSRVSDGFDYFTRVCPASFPYFVSMNSLRNLFAALAKQFRTFFWFCFAVFCFFPISFFICIAFVFLLFFPLKRRSCLQNKFFLLTLTCMLMKYECSDHENKIA